MKRLIWLISILPVTANLNAQRAPLSIDKLVNRLTNEFAADTSTASLSIGILYKGQSWFYNTGKTMPTKHSVYEIGSITKTFTSLVLAHAVSEGKVSLDDDVRKYLDGNYTNLTYNGQPIHLLNLANTSSALPDNIINVSKDIINKKDFFDTLATVKLDTLPGAKPRHSNTAAMLLSFILEKIYNESIDVLIGRYVLDPLGMKETSFPGTVMPAGMMQGYGEKGNTADYLVSPLSKGTGSMRSTTSDMIKYLIYLQQNSTAESKLALAPAIFVNAATNTTAPFASINTVNDRVYAVSLNWLQYHPEKDNLRIWTDGGTPGFRSYIVLYPETELAMIFLSNRTGRNMLDKIFSISDQVFKALRQL